MNFDTNLIKIGDELRKLWATEYFNIGGMSAAILNILWGFKSFKNHFIKVVFLINLVYFGENDCLSLELNIFFFKSVAKYCWKPFIIWFCIFNLTCVPSQSLKYGGIHDSHFEYIQTTITSLFLGRFWKILHQNKWIAKYFTPRHTYSLYCVPFIKLGRLVWVLPGRKPWKQVFSWRGSSLVSGISWYSSIQNKEKSRKRIFMSELFKQ